MLPNVCFQEVLLPPNQWKCIVHTRSQLEAEKDRLRSLVSHATFLALITNSLRWFICTLLTGFPFFDFYNFPRTMKQERFSSSNHKSLLSGLVHNWPDKFEKGVFTLHRRIFRFVIEESRAGKSQLSWYHRFQKALFQNVFLSTQKRNAETRFSYFSNTTILVFLLFIFIFLVFFYLVKLIIFTFPSI